MASGIIDSDARTAPAHPVTDGERFQSERGALALDASYQLDALLDALLDMVRRDVDSAAQEVLLRAVLPRMKDLASVVMSVLGREDGRATADLAHVVSGKGA